MVNSDLIGGDGSGLGIDPEVALALAYGPARVRPALHALWSFDGRLGTILRTTREPTLGQLRLTWWHDAVAHPGAIPGEPVLAALADAGHAPARLQRIVEGWESLLDGEDDAALATYASGRGGDLFAAAAAALGASDNVEPAGAGWALVDLARHHSRPEVVRRALALAGDQLADAPVRWTRPGRPLGMLAKLARRDLVQPEQQASPRRVAAMARLALIGR